MKKNKRVLVTGVFDLLHQEHRAFLRNAKALGDELVVGVESDWRVKQLKGEGRPIQTAAQRVEAIKNLGIADRVVVLPEQFNKPQQHLNFLKQIRPQLLAVSSHTPHLLEKQRLMSKIGGKVVVVRQHNPQISTTKQLEAQRVH